MRTNPGEFTRFLKFLPFDVRKSLWLIPLRRYSKKPDLPEGVSTLNPEYRLTLDQAVNRLSEGLNVGLMARGDIALLDIDAAYKSGADVEVKPTLTWRTRNGGLCKLYINKGIDFNAAREGYGELRAVNQYVVAPGSYVPPDERSRGGDGRYVIIDPRPPSTLTPDEIPDWLRGKPYKAKPVKVKPEAPPPDGWKNCYGFPLDSFRRADRKLDRLLSELNPPEFGYPSRSEADMAAAGILWRYGFTAGQIAGILRQYRAYEKTMRDDYLELTIGKVMDDPQMGEVDLLTFLARSASEGWALERLKEMPPVVDVGQTFTYTGDRRFEGRVQVVALGFPEARFTRLRFTCDVSDCKVSGCPFGAGNGLILDIDEEFDPSALTTYFDTNRMIDAAAVYVGKAGFPRCPGWRRKVIAHGDKERAITRGMLVDLQGREGRAWFVHGERCDLSKAPNWIIAKGWLCKGARGRIGVLITEFTHEAEVMAPSEEEVEKARKVLKKLPEGDGLEGSGAWKIAEILRKKCNAKGREVTKGFAADLLTIAGPVWVKTPESGCRELGPTTNELGPSTNYKSQRAKFLTSWLGAGKYLRGRKTEAGLTAGLERVEGIGWVAKKGALPSADLSFIIVDNMSPHVLDEQIESRRDGIVSITGIKTMDVWARCRLKLLSNPQQPFDELVYKCVALKMFDSKLVARFTFTVYTYGIPADERYDSTLYTLDREEEAVLEAARVVLRWNLSRETVYEVSERLWPEIMRLSRVLEEKYGVEDIPLLLRNIPYKLAVLAYSFALLEGETEPSKRHYDLAYRWLDFTARDIELDKYAENQRALRQLSDEEYQAIKKALEEQIAEEIEEIGGEPTDGYTYRLIEYILKHGTAQRDEVASYLDLAKDTVSRKVSLLKGLGLLKSTRAGYSFTPKGVRFIKRWISEVAKITTLEGEARIREEYGKPRKTRPVMENQKLRVTPRNGDFSDFTDLTGGIRIVDTAFQAICELCGGEAGLVVEYGGRRLYVCNCCLKDLQEGGKTYSELPGREKESGVQRSGKMCPVCGNPVDFSKEPYTYYKGEPVHVDCYKSLSRRTGRGRKMELVKESSGELGRRALEDFKRRGRA